MRYLGIDFGLRRVGLATSEQGQLASPWKVVEGSGFDDLVEKIKKEARSFNKVVIGLPEGKMGKIVKRVARSLREKGVDVLETDETLSSQIATQKMLELNISKKKRRVNDDIAAAIILQNYIESLNKR